MGDLTRRVQQAAAEADSHGAVLPPRAAAKAERTARADRRRLDRDNHRTAVRIETDRRTQLAHIMNTFRKVAKDAQDVGTIGFSRLKTFKKYRARLGRRPRGWIVGAGAVPVEFAEGVRELEAQLILAVDGRLYAAIDGVIGDRYQVGQTTSPTTPWMLTVEIWRLVEDTVPDTVGRLVGSLDLAWPLD